METLILISCLVICYYTGSTIEKKHYENIKAREAALSKTLCMTYGKAFSRSTKIKNSYLVSSSVVIGCDYFKAFLAYFRNLFGGNISAYESVLDRGKREAILRMKEQASARKAHAIINTKIETVMLDPLGSKEHPKVCVTAYGTAIEYNNLD
ncbi:heavy metal-binding domain-containing protein [bacterium]|nr:heavy metal-binding domain-containing protein [bacterium]